MIDTLASESSGYIVVESECVTNIVRRECRAIIYQDDEIELFHGHHERKKERKGLVVEYG